MLADRLCHQKASGKIDIDQSCPFTRIVRLSRHIAIRDTSRVYKDVGDAIGFYELADGLVDGLLVTHVDVVEGDGD